MSTTGMSALSQKHGGSQIAARWRLVLFVAALSFLWLIVLPWVAKQWPVDANLRWLDEQRVDPSAMYYTELEAMKPILARLHKRERSRTAMNFDHLAAER